VISVFLRRKSERCLFPYKSCVVRLLALRFVLSIYFWEYIYERKTFVVSLVSLRDHFPSGKVNFLCWEPAEDISFAPVDSQLEHFCSNSNFADRQKILKSKILDFIFGTRLASGTGSPFHKTRYDYGSQVYWTPCKKGIFKAKKA
jgi:hypothetical protein